MNRLIEGKDFYYNKQGYVVFTEAYHLEKGFCCGNGCLHCPYQHVNVPASSVDKNPTLSLLMLTKNGNGSQQ